MDLLDTQELSEIKKLIGDMPIPDSPEKGEAPAPSNVQKPVEGNFVLDEILSEVSDVVIGSVADKGQNKRVSQAAAKVAQAPEAVAYKETQQSKTPLVSKAEVNAAANAPVLPEKPNCPPPEPRVGEPRAVESGVEDFGTRRALRKAKKAARESEQLAARDPKMAQRTCAKHARGLAPRAVLVLLLTVFVTYLTMADGKGWPLPDSLSFAHSAVLAVLTMMLSQFIAMFIGIDVVGLGYYNLFTGKPDHTSLVAASLTASFLHGLTIILFPSWEAMLPYCAVSIAMLYAAMCDTKNRYAARSRTFRAVLLSDQPTAIFGHYDPSDRPRRALKAKTESTEPFLLEMEKPDYADCFYTYYTPLALAVCIIFALVVSIGKGEAWRFFWALAALLAIASPVGLLCAAGAPTKHVARNLLVEGAALAGARQARRLRAAKEVLLFDSDLFPNGTITLERFENYGVYTDEKVLACAAAITESQKLEIGRVFSEALREMYGRPVKAANLLRYPAAGGLSADIGGDSVMLGTASFMNRMGVRMREFQGGESSVFLTINSRPAAAFAVVYHPSAQTYEGIHALRRLGVRPLIAALDFNISPAMVESLFELKHGIVTEAGTERAAVYTDPAYVSAETPDAILSRDGLRPYIAVLQAADKLAGAVISNLAIGGVAGVCGILIVFYLTLLYQVAAVTPQNILLYLLLWAMPVWFNNHQTKKNK